MNFKEKEKNSSEDLLSLSKKLTMPETKLELNNVSKINNHQEKQILTIYTDDNELMYINRAAAYALGLIDTRAIMLDNDESLVPFSEKQLAVILNRENLDLDFRKIEQVQKIPKKQSIKVYRDNLNCYIDMSAAYALGLISIETFNAMCNELYPVSENLLVFLQNKYAVEFQELGENFGSR